MCWYSDKVISPKVATEDIQVYKVVVKSDNIIFSGVFPFKWKSGVVYQSKIDVMPYYPQMQITKGFHTLRDRPCITGEFWYTLDGHPLFMAFQQHDVFKAIIPEGSTYYENEHGEIVSDKLKVIWQQ